MQFVVAVFRRKRWARRKNDAAECEVRIVSKKRFDRIKGGASASQVLWTEFEEWVESDGAVEVGTKLEAWEAAFLLHATLLEETRSVSMQNIGNSKRRLYVFEMEPRVMEVKKFAEMNANVARNGQLTCVYVGQTAKRIRDRYASHQDETARSKTKWGRKYFKTPIEVAGRKDLVDEFHESTGLKINRLTEYEALKNELRLRQWLQSEKGIAAYSK